MNHLIRADDEDDTEDENAEEAPSAEKEVASASGEADTKKT
jgi:prostaglandin-E synthase